MSLLVPMKKRMMTKSQQLHLPRRVGESGKRPRHPAIVQSENPDGERDETVIGRMLLLLIGIPSNLICFYMRSLASFVIRRCCRQYPRYQQENLVGPIHHIRTRL